MLDRGKGRMRKVEKERGGRKVGDVGLVGEIGVRGKVYLKGGEGG